MKIYIGVRAEESLLSDRINNELLIIKFGPHSTVGIPAKGPISPPAARCAVNDKCFVLIYRCYIRDDSRSIAVAIQVEAANRLPVLL